MKEKRKTYFAFIPIADKKKFLSILLFAEHYQMARGILKEAMVTLFPGDVPITDEEIINFHDLKYKGDVLIETMQIGSDGKLIEDIWIAVLQSGISYTLSGVKDKQKAKQELSTMLVDLQPPVNFTGDLYELVGNEKAVLLHMDLSDEFIETIRLGQFHIDKNTTIH